MHNNEIGIRTATESRRNAGVKGLLHSRTLLNAALWATLLICAWLLYPNQVGHAETSHAHSFIGFKIVASLLWGLLWGFGAFALATRCGYAAWVGWPVALAGLLAFQYLEVTGPTSVRQHDIEGHREYIDHLTTEHRLPAVREGWETWQPPLYSVAAAIWRWACSGRSFQDPFRAVQWFAAALYLASSIATLVGVRPLGVHSLEATGALGLLALLPGIVFFAGRINNDVILPVLGVGLLFTIGEFVRTGKRRWLCWLAVVLPALLATKGSSLAIVGGALALVICAGACRSGWWTALWQAFLTGLPAAVWQVFWWVHTATQTGNPFYVNADLPEDMRIHAPTWRRLCSFDFAAFIHGGFYNDAPMRRSYPTALITSLLYGEYGMQDYAFRWPGALRCGCLGMLLVLAAGALLRPRPELRPVWITCLVLAGCQTLIVVMYAIQFPFSCNQNMRFFAPAFVPLCGLFGLGLGHFWQSKHCLARVAVAMVLAVILLGLADFYRCLLFTPL